MSDIAIRRTISTVPQNLWKVLGDPKRIRDWYPRVVEFTCDPQTRISPGFKFHIARDTAYGFQETDAEITGVEQEKKVVWREVRSSVNQQPMTQVTDVRTTVIIEEFDGGTEVRIICSWQPVGITGTVFSALYFRRSIHKMCEEALMNLSFLV